MNDALATTTSLCPDCLEQVPGRYEERDGGVFLARECPDHGRTSRRVWGSLDHWEWAADFGPDPEHDGGDLTVDPDHACLAVVEVTEDCNLSCSYCFASSGPGGAHRSTEKIEALLATVADAGGRPVQFSGGEPTVRDDLPALVERARDRGIDHVEVNTNGIRLATEDGYARELADAGVTAVYLQFDGLTSETYEQIREVDLVAEKHAAIEACRDADLPVVLVPTVVPGVNDHEMGDIVRFALENRDVVRSVNFQPVAHFGRYAKNDGRFALDDVTRLLAEQVETLDPRDMLPAPCCSAYCQIGTAFVPEDGATGVDGGPDRTDGDAPDDRGAGVDFVPLTQYVDDRLWDTLAERVDEGDYMELLAGTAAGEEWACKTAGCCEVDVPGGTEGLFDEVVPVSITGFMDADAADVSRLSNCCISVPTADGDLVPFCGYNMTTEDGEYALRNRNGWGGRRAVDEPSEGESAGYRGDRTVTDGGTPGRGGRVMEGLLDAALADPWRTLDAAVDGPLHPGGRAATARLLDRADVGPGTRLLEVGCGAGDALAVARERGADAVGIDPSPAADRAVRADATALPVRDGSVDVVLAECVLCLTDLPTALAEAHRALADGGRLAVSDVVVDGDRPAVPDRVAEALCLSGARSRERLTTHIAAAGFEVEGTYDRREDLLAMRDRVAEGVDYEGLLGVMGDRGQRILDAIEAVEAAIEEGDVGYVSIVASA